jgi:hypothetical protein
MSDKHVCECCKDTLTVTDEKHLDQGHVYCKACWYGPMYEDYLEDYLNKEKRAEP